MSYFPYEDAAEKRKSQTHCVNGHPFSEENTRWEERTVLGTTYRIRRCLACRREVMRRWQVKAREAAKAS